jgi:hypothetical protein
MITFLINFSFESTEVDIQAAAEAMEEVVMGKSNFLTL